MGYMGLDSYGASDAAADAMCSMVHAALNSLKKSYKEDKDNGPYNTDGDVNVCLIIESGIFDFEGVECYVDDYLNFFKEVQESMKKKIKNTETNKENWDNENNRLNHLKSYKRLAKSLDTFVEKISKGY